MDVTDEYILAYQSLFFDIITVISW